MRTEVQIKDARYENQELFNTESKVLNENDTLILDISTLEISDIEILIQHYDKQLKNICNNFTSKKHDKNILAYADVLSHLRQALNTKINKSNIKEQVR